MSEPEVVALVVRRVIPASPERLFAAWTMPEQLVRWWGPAAVRCTAAEIDLRVGGGYRLENLLPDGKVLVIVGTFEAIEPPLRLVYSWSIGGPTRTRLATEPSVASERVTVRFEPRGDATEVIVVHERIANADLARGHQDGWEGCLDGLAAHFG
jgi:uncharacterized protein YndB with AHSA1/START domain